MNVEKYSKRKTQSYAVGIPELFFKFLDKTDWETYLDLGCGDGFLLRVLNKKGYFDNKIVYAIDLSRNNINLVTKINKSFRCFVDDACNIKSIQTNSIDFLVSTQVIEHVQDDESMVKEITKVLNKNGTVYLSTVFKKWTKRRTYNLFLSVIPFIFSLLIFGKLHKCDGKWALDATHRREYTQDNQLLDILRKYNFKVIESKKSLLTIPILYSVFRRIVKEDLEGTFSDRFLNFLRYFKIPLFGYYTWDIVCHPVLKRSV